ncbi:hypothetical protein FFLO_04233 [Filobasidium floriforme]|uniref:Uncharacterized protein n=1 Tax=Filobasidium floriforme TaxID=5210 RepID=A0A8K0JJT8_9TREE|nr:hypothetical protein FFLO_04233 [Filobasidium floriforme]
MADLACRFTAAKSDLHHKVVALGEQNLSTFIFGYLPDTRVANGMRIRYKVWIALKAFSRTIPDITSLGLPGFMFTRREWDGALVAWNVWVRQRYETADAELLGQRMEAVTKTLFEAIDLNGDQEQVTESEARFENERRCYTDEHWSRP